MNARAVLPWVFVAGLVPIVLLFLWLYGREVKDETARETEAEAGALPLELPKHTLPIPVAAIPERHAAPDDLTTILVTTEAGDVVGGARVAYETPTSWAAIGVTDDAGTVSATLPEEELHIVVLAAGHFALPLKTVPPHPPDIRVTLSDAGAISGRVVTAKDKANVGAGVRVVACGEAYVTTATRFRQQFEGFPSAKIATTDANGQFRLDGLDPKASYRLTAGGRGTMLFNNYDIPEIPCGTTGVELEVGVLHAAIVTLVDDSGVGLGNFRQLYGDRSIRIGPMGDFMALTEYSPAFQLAHPFRLNPKDQGTLTWFLVSDTADRLEHPSRLELNLPGYAPVEEDVWLAPIVDEANVFQTVTVRRIAEGFGTLGITLARETLKSHLEIASVAPCLGELVFFQEGKRKFAYSVTSESQQSIAGIPHGTYDIGYFHAFDMLPMQRELDLADQVFHATVGDDEEAEGTEIVIDLGIYGGLLLTDNGGHLGGDRHLLTVVDIHQNRLSKRMVVSGFPFFVDAMLPGEYRVSLRALRGDPRAEPVVAIVYGGSITSVGVP